MKKLILAILLSMLLLSCSESTPPLPTTPALGDSPTLTGTIANLKEAKLEGENLVVKAVIYSSSLKKEKVIAQSTVNSSGIFSLNLPGISDIANDCTKASNDGSSSCS